MFNRKVLLIAILSVIVLGFLAATAVAQDTAAQQGAPPERTLGDNIMASMPVGAVIILVSVAALGLIIEHFINVRRDKVIPPEIVGELEILFDDANASSIMPGR